MENFFVITIFIKIEDFLKNKNFDKVFQELLKENRY